MAAEVSLRGACLIVAVRGVFDPRAAVRCLQAARATPTPQRVRVLFDLRECSGLDPAGIGALTFLRGRFDPRSDGATLRLADAALLPRLRALRLDRRYRIELSLRAETGAARP